MHRDLSRHVLLDLVVVMRDDYDQVILRQPGQQSENAFRRLDVEVAGRFVGHDYRGVLRKGPCYGNALLLAAREFAGLSAPVLLEAYLFYDVVHAGLYLTAAVSGQEERQFHVLVYGVVIDEVERLEDVSDVAFAVLFHLVAAESARGLAHHVHLAFLEGIEAGDDVQQSRFTAAALAGDGHELAYVEVQAHLAEAGGDDSVG